MLLTNGTIAHRTLLEAPPTHPVIGLITCKQLREKGNSLGEWARIVHLLESDAFHALLGNGHRKLAVTGGTYAAFEETLQDRRVLGRMHCLAPSALGVIQVANLLVFGRLEAVFFFNDMEDTYADSPQNLCLRRLCNQHRTPLCEDFSSIEFVVQRWSRDASSRLPALGVQDKLRLKALLACYCGDDEEIFRDDVGPGGRKDRTRETLAVVSHDQKKMTMLNFCLRHLDEILSYRRVLTTGTTGRRLRDQTVSALKLIPRNRFNPRWGYTGRESLKEFVDRKINPFESGPCGGDIQISAKVIDGTCHRVLFFQDPARAHPRQFDIRLLEKAAQGHRTAVLLATSEQMAEVIV